jgi:hypothetical protein
MTADHWAFFQEEAVSDQPSYQPNPCGSSRRLTGVLHRFYDAQLIHHE